MGDSCLGDLDLDGAFCCSVYLTLKTCALCRLGCKCWELQVKAMFRALSKDPSALISSHHIPGSGPHTGQFWHHCPSRDECLSPPPPSTRPLQLSPASHCPGIGVKDSEAEPGGCGVRVSVMMAPTLSWSLYHQAPLLVCISFMLVHFPFL